MVQQPGYIKGRTVVRAGCVLDGPAYSIVTSACQGPGRNSRPKVNRNFGRAVRSDQLGQELHRAGFVACVFERDKPCQSCR